MSDHTCDVLIVGAGPTGATLGLLLARQGVRTIVIDKEVSIYPLPRAAHIDHEIVRIFQELGLAASVMATSRAVGRYDFLNADGEVLLRFDGADRTGPGGWPASNMIHQPSLEAALRSAIAQTPALTLLTGRRFGSFAEEADGVYAKVETPDGHERIRARYLVGADGARSPVREAAGIGWDDLHFDEPWLVIDAIVHDAARLPAINLQICNPARPTTCVLMGAGRHRWEFMLRPGESADDVLDDAFIAKLLAPWDVDGAVTLERKAVYRFNARMAAQWRKGRILLAGDAAHLMPPFAGQGLCSGLRDGPNLAWKLAAVLGGADDALLDTYQPERAPHVRAIIDMAIMMGRTVCITDPEAARQRDAQMLAARGQGGAPGGALAWPPMQEGCLIAGAPAAGLYFPQPVAGGQRLDDVLGPGAWLISRTRTGAMHGLRCATLDDEILAPFRTMLDEWLTAHHAEAVLVRPDRTVFAGGDPAHLAKAWKRHTRQ